MWPGSDARVDNPILQSWRFRDGKVIRLEMLGALAPNFRMPSKPPGLRSRGAGPYVRKRFSAARIRF